MPETVTWLHISDTHFCEKKHGWESNEIIEKFYDDLKLMKDKHNLYPDLVFFTGDLALGQIGNSKGLTLKDQYEEAKVFFERILKIFPELDVSNIFIVPGNHDVNRDKVLGSQTAWLDSLRIKKSVDVNRTINNLAMSNTREWKLIIERLEDYKIFLEDVSYKHLLVDPDRLSYSIIRPINKFKVGIAGLNSAWSSCRDDENGKLWFGTYQIHKTCNDLNSSTFSIAISHHPPNWFTELEDFPIDIKIENKFNFYLHGHQHQDWVRPIGKHIRIASGALYNGSDKENGYNFVRIYPNENRGEIFLRTYNNDTWIQKIVGNKTNNEGIWAIKELNINIKEEDCHAMGTPSDGNIKQEFSSIHTNKRNERLEEYEKLYDKIPIVIVNQVQALSDANSSAKTENKKDINLNVYVSTDLKIDLPQIQADLPQIQADFENLRREITKLNPELKNELDEIQDSLDEISTNSEKEKLNKPLNKLRRFLIKLEDPNSDYNKVIKGTQKGIELAQKVGRTYNKFAQWLPIPVIPDLYLGK